MITFIVPEYCQILYGDTYVECEYRHRCKAIYEYLEKEKNK